MKEQIKFNYRGENKTPEYDKDGKCVEIKGPFIKEVLDENGNVIEIIEVQEIKNIYKG